MTSHEVLLVALAAAGSFLVGSVPFGVLIARAHGRDIRAEGSRNIGATNVWRVLGPKPGLLCFTLDALKGLAPALLAGWWLGALGRFDVPTDHAVAWLAIGIVSVVGHMFSPWVGFKGGKGVATGFGAVLGFFPWLTVPGVLALLAWLIVLKATRYVSVASIVAASTLALATPLVLPAARALGLAPAPRDGAPADLAVTAPFLVCAAALAALVIFRHRANIARLRAGTENRFGPRRA